MDGALVVNDVCDWRSLPKRLSEQAKENDERFTLTVVNKILKKMSLNFGRFFFVYFAVQFNFVVIVKEKIGR